jgi:hypothetical protein
MVVLASDRLKVLVAGSCEREREVRERAYNPVPACSDLGCSASAWAFWASNRRLSRALLVLNITT